MPGRILKSIAIVFFFSFLVGSFNISCKKEENFPIEPVIVFESFSRIKAVNGTDSIGVLSFRFTDGDGDIGLGPADTLSPYKPGSPFYYNFFVTAYEKDGGIYKKVSPAQGLPEGDTLTNNGRIPDLQKLSQGKGIKGIIEMTLFINNPFSENDTIKYDVSICDRALHRSNTITTPEIVLKK